jgi:hypothetical protein
MLTALARELVTQKGVGERADELWRAIQRQQAQVNGCSRPAIVEASASMIGEGRAVQPTQTGSSEPAVTANAFVEMAVDGSRNGPKSRHDNDAQLSLAF